jgi:hypothetical protein
LVFEVLSDMELEREDTEKILIIEVLHLLLKKLKFASKIVYLRLSDEISIPNYLDKTKAEENKKLHSL